MNAWWCPCGEHSEEPRQPASARALTTHLIATGHRYGEYFYGCGAQRTTVSVRLDDDGNPRHELLPR